MKQLSGGLKEAGSTRVTRLLSSPSHAAAPRPGPVQHGSRSRPTFLVRGAGRNADPAPPTPSSSSSSSIDADFPDPEAKFKRYGKFFGGGYRLDADWLKDVPQVRIRKGSETRKMDELLELAVLNERLAGNMSAWEARRKLEYLKMRRRNWELVYAFVTEEEVTASLEVIEEAYARAEELISAESKEHNSISQLKSRMMDLQSDIAEAEQKLAMTRTRVSQNLKRINSLKAEAEVLERASKGGVATARVTQTQAAPVAARPAPSVPRMREEPAPQLTNVEVMQRRRKGLQSSMEIEPQLKNFWFPVEFTARLAKDTMVPFEIFNEPWVLFRDEAGQPACVRDQCAHRACPLSLGKVDGGQVVCAYHGWKFDGKGQCTEMPSTPHCRNVAVAALPCVEKDGFVWIWPGEAEPDDVPDYTRPPAGFDIHAEIMVDVPVEHGLLMENLLDLAHAPFTHVSTFARGWPVPEFVKFHASKMFSGNWDPYPIEMAFQPPCMVLSLIGLAQPGKIMRGVTADQCAKHLHQLHVCMPSKRGHTRLLYRMSLDFLPWVRYVPFIDRVWKAIAGQVLSEDLVLVLGQQDRLQRGGDTWSFPVPYDKLGVRYRRWRNAVAAGTGSAAELAAAGAISGASMSAGEMFSVDEEEASMAAACGEEQCSS